MAYKKRYVRKKRTYKKRMYKKKRMMRKKRGETTFHCKRGATTPVNIFGTSNSGQFGISENYVYKLDNIVNPGNFTSLFTYYRINMVKHKFYVRYAVVNGTQLTTAYDQPIRLWWMQDHDGQGSNSIAEIRGHANAKHAMLTHEKPVTMLVKPSSLSEFYQSTVSTAYKPMYKQWHRCSNSAVPHYGIVWATDSLVPGREIHIETTYYLSFKTIQNGQ